MFDINNFQSQQTHILPESIDRKWVESVLGNATIKETKIFDFTNTRRIDSTGLSYLRLLQKKSSQNELTLQFVNTSPEINKLLNAWKTENKISSEQKLQKPLLESLGELAIHTKDNLLDAISVLAEMIYWGTIGCLKRQDFRKGSLGEQMYLLGYKALGIVLLLSFLIGLVLALQTAIQLKLFGAAIFLAPLMGITMVREMGPLLTAIILAGRTGSATTAEIATMGVGEEIDALRTMGINPIQFVVVPKFWAITITMPLLSIIATSAGIFGGYCIAILYLDLGSNLYWGELAKNLYMKDFMAGFIKSVVFSWLIIWIGAYYGFRVRGGAEAVGRETTASVVTGIFVIIIADALFSFIL